MERQKCKKKWRPTGVKYMNDNNNMWWSLKFSHSVMSDSLWPHGLQQARFPCSSPTPRPCSNSCPLSQWCHQTISSSVVPFSSCFQSFLASGTFPIVSSSHQMVKISEFQLQYQSFQWIFRTDFLSDWLTGSPCTSRDSQESSPTPHTVQRHQFFGAKLSL